jgi:hypothetical protein
MEVGQRFSAKQLRVSLHIYVISLKDISREKGPGESNLQLTRAGYKSRISFAKK